MKNAFFYLLVFCFFANVAMAQKSYEIRQDADLGMSQGVHTALVLDVPNIGTKQVKKDWASFIKGYKSKSKGVKKSKEELAEGAKIPAISADPVNIFTAFDYSKSMKTTTVKFWFQIEGVFLNPEANPEQHESASSLMQEFAKSIDKRLAEEEVSRQEKTYKKMAGDMKKLKKDKKNYEKKIEDAKALIVKMEKNIEINESDQANKQQEMESQSEVVNEAKKVVEKF